MPDPSKPDRYDPASFEAGWQEAWERDGLYRTREDSGKPRYYALFEFPYPSGDGLHVGHLRPYTGMDAVARKRRMQGHEVLFPVGWDAFGLPAESYAIRTGIHPAVVTKKNIANFKRQMQAMGYSFDWDREVDTSDPAYYRWTQWMFIRFFEAGLAYKATQPINWCPKDRIGLANEEVVGGACERCGTPVVQKEKEQWMLRITAYADQLLAGLDEVDFLPEIKAQQENWIGRSEGAEIPFALSTGDEARVFTTRPDTLFGATYLVLAPEHPLTAKLAESAGNREAVLAYCAEAAKKSDRARAIEGGKTGVPLEGVTATNPGTGGQVPVWIADYVLAGYGTGAIMAVPAHDERDFAFARAHGLPVVPVVVDEGAGTGVSIQVSDDDLSDLASRLRALGEPREHVTPSVRRYALERADEALAILAETGAAQPGDRALASGFELDAETGRALPLHVFTGTGTLVNSGRFSGRPSQEALAEIAESVGGVMKVQYRLRDWVFSRQRYWGEPIPLIRCEDCGWQPVPDDQLPVVLPDVERYEPRDDGESPLASVEDWVKAPCPKCGKEGSRETDTMPNWAGSSWYFLRYVDPKNDEAFASKELLERWMPVDWYNGGMEHVTLHLLYSRFWNRFLFDQGLVPVAEPYRKRTAHGMILAADGSKMSKSKGNVVNPDEVVARYGVDALRVYESFIGPFDQATSWDPQGIEGTYRFLSRVFALAGKVGEGGDETLLRAAKKAARKVGDDIEDMAFNTAVAALMVWTNEATKAERVPQEAWELFLRALAPFAPHLAEELWHRLGKEGSVHLAPWPEIGDGEIAEDTVRIAVQVNGRTRDEVAVPVGATQEEVAAAALESQKVKVFVFKQPSRVVFVEGRIINFVL